MSCFCVTDFNMKSLKDDWLDEESIKGVIDPSEPGSYPARYHVAQLPVHKARMFAVNAGKQNGTTDFGWWFDTQPNCEALGMLARGLADEIRDLPDSAQAVARRTVIFRIVDRGQIGLNVKHAAASLEEELRLELAREEEQESMSR